MSKGVGPRIDRGPALGRVDRPQRLGAPGIYGGGGGGGNYPTILEAYNRDSDYKRWRTGLDYWQGSGKSWGDRTEYYLIQPFRDYGSSPGPWMTSVTYFPSDGSPDGTWTLGCRRRGAIILPQALATADIGIDTSHPAESQHRLILDVSATLNQIQLESWKSLVGDQFEDSAEGTQYPSGLLEEPIDTIAYTLVDVNEQEGKLLFDLSRPYMRRRPDRLKPRAFWQKIIYNRRRPIAWRADGSRYLCSSHKLFCSCPDFSGSRIADLSSEGESKSDRFPSPSPGRSVGSAWESREVGYKTRWRDLSDRMDRRRECKHMHALRWSLGYPYYEPSDYEIGGSDRQFTGGSGGSLTSEEVARYHRKRGLSLDRLAPTLAELSGVDSSAGDSVSFEEGSPVQPGRRPILWTEDREPDASRCVQGDWWMRRGSATLLAYSQTAKRFTKSIVIGGNIVPLIEKVDADTLIN
jgi:hypothetical protein